MTPCMSSKYSNQLSYASATVDIIPHAIWFVNPFFEFFLKKSKVFLYGLLRGIFYPKDRKIGDVGDKGRTIAFEELLFGKGAASHGHIPLFGSL